jgi:hypothetical protein
MTTETNANPRRVRGVSGGWAVAGTKALGGDAIDLIKFGLFI